MTTLKEIIENRQLYESYPIQLLDNQTASNKDEFINALAIVNKYLQQLDSGVINNDPTFEKDLTDVKFYINNILYDLRK